MFERLTTPQEAYEYKLGAALTMERRVLSILEDSIEEAQDTDVEGVFRHHHVDTKGHVRNLEEAFGLFGWEVDDSPCPAIDGLMAEAKANATKTDKSLIDAVLLQGAVEVEHHEIAVYENLIIHARALGREDVAAVLARNLSSESQTLEEVKRVLERVAADAPEEPAGVTGGQGVMDKVKDALS
jgi:ferritin-like metal-binding protein YciE